MKAQLLTVGVLTVVLGAGCGEPTTTVTTVISTQTTGTVRQGGQTASPQTSAAPREANHEAPGTVPDEAGARLDVAEADLTHRGLAYRVVAAGKIDLGSRRKWTVCEMNPSPRTHLESGTTIRLIVGRTCRPAKR